LSVNGNGWRLMKLDVSTFESEISILCAQEVIKVNEKRIMLYL